MKIFDIYTGNLINAPDIAETLKKNGSWGREADFILVSL